MKLLIMFFLAITLNAQSLLTLMSDNTAPNDADAQAYFDALTTPLSSDRQDTINQFINMLEDSLGTEDLSTYFDRFYIIANETEESALQSIVNVASTDASKGGTITFAVDRGFAGNGTTGYLNTNYTPSTDASVYTQNSASLGIYSRTNSAVVSMDIGVSVTHASYLASRYNTSTAYAKTNQVSGGPGLSSSDSRGLFIATRTASNAQAIYRNDASLGTDNDASSGLPTGDIYIGCYNYAGSPDVFSTRQYAVAFIAKGLTLTEARKIYNCVEWYLDSIGAGVM